MNISDFDESKQTDDSIKKLCAAKQYLSKAQIRKIAAYLTKREFADAASTARVYDVFSKAYTEKYCRVNYTDGLYEWTSEEIYYFEKYHLMLDDTFISYVLEK